tara:strand:- start:1727 stop:2227 length:501 start_codon:yes stop_codon:yes gene_type:complete
VSVRDLTLVGSTAALAVVLGLVFKALPLPRMPYGGSISLESLPILYLATWRGLRPGIAAGVLCGLIQLLLGAHIFHPVQIVLDYPVAFGFLGLGGMFAGSAVWACVVGGSARFIAHFVSGIVFFGSYAPEGTSVWVYAALYNLSYLIPETVLCAALLPFLLRRTLA